MILPENLHYAAADKSVFGSILLENGLSADLIATSVKVLDELTLKKFWNLNFGNDGKKRRIPEDFWMFRCKRRSERCYWIEELKLGGFGRVADCLRTQFNRSEDTEMCFFGGIEIVLVRWKYFTKYWNSFVEFNDEGLLVEISQQSGVIVSPNGYFAAVE